MDDEPRLPALGDATSPGAGEPLPRLRPVEAMPVEVDGQQVICLRDPAGLTDKVALVPRPVLAIVALLDGTRSTSDVQADFARAHGEQLPLEALATLVARLDEALLLDTDRFRRRRAEVLDEYRRAPTRPAVHARDSYPEDPSALRRFLDELFARGAPTRPGTGRAPDEPRVRGIVTPHIDFGRGGEVYADAYRPLLEEAAPDLYVVLGTDHHGDGALYSLTAKHFDTPLGPVRVDEDAVDRLARGPGRFLDGELNHRQEHSIEFQAVVLRYLTECRGETAPPVMLPLLCGSFDDFLATGTAPTADPQLAALRGALAEVCRGRRVVFIAAGDLAHVGPNFGDPHPLGEQEEQALEGADRLLLERIADADPDGLLRLLQAQGDGRRVCGLPPIYTMLQLLGDVSGEVVSYRQCPAGADGGSRVSVAAVLFRGPFHGS